MNEKIIFFILIVFIISCSKPVEKKLEGIQTEVIGSETNPKFSVQYPSGTDIFKVEHGGNIYITSGTLTISGDLNATKVNATNSTAVWLVGNLDTGVIQITDDIDDAHIETDLNTYVDIAGDTMTGRLNIDNNLNLTQNITMYTNSSIFLNGTTKRIYANDTCMIVTGPTSEVAVC